MFLLVNPANPFYRDLPKVIARLAKFYGKPKPPITTDPFELILLENVAYPVSDERRAEAFALLAVAAVGGYFASLDALSRVAEQKKEVLIEALCR